MALIRKTAHMKKTISRRLLPALIAVPIPEREKRADHFHRPGSVAPPNEADKLGPKDAAILEALEALCAVIELTLSFLISGSASVRRSTEWLVELRGELDDLENELRRGSLAMNTSSPADDVSALHEILGRLPEFGADLDEPPDPAFSKLITFWLVEIKGRGRELYNICIGSVDPLAAKHVFQEVRALRYPLAR